MKQSVELKFWPYKHEIDLLKKLEEIGRNAYQSFERTSEDSCYRFIEMIIKKGHLGILEHEIVTFKIVTNRAIANELVRHRHASYVQESTRYVNYKKKKPAFITGVETYYGDETKLFETYKQLIDNNVSPENARDFLPLGLKTTIYATMNIRSWFHFLEVRSTVENHPMMRELAKLILTELTLKMPNIALPMTASLNNISPIQKEIDRK